MSRPSIVIVTPALAAANNGNWQTAQRWRRFLAQDYRVGLTERWQAGDEALMIALHARRSAPSIAAWRERHPARPLLLVLTGTDLYRDIAVDAAAQASLEQADRLVVLNDLGARILPQRLRAKTRVCLQSAPTLKPQPKTTRHLRLLMVGHLRDEKDPRTYLQAARLLQQRTDLRFDHIGGGLDAALAAEARALMAEHPRYRWLGALPHAATRRHIARAHALVHASVMEGGAHVVIEAVTSGTPVLASRIDGNLGLLGSDYEGVFDPGDGAALAALILRARDDPAWLPRLAQQLAPHTQRFAPQAERAAVQGLVAALLRRSRRGHPG